MHLTSFLPQKLHRLHHESSSPDTWHIRSAASSGTAFATTPVAASSSFASLSMTTKTIRIQLLFFPRRHLRRSLRCRRQQRRYRLNHVGNQHGILFVRIYAFRRSNLIDIDRLTLIAVGSALVIHRALALLFQCTSLYFAWV